MSNVESGSLGQLPPRYTFALNPRLFARVNQCPDCRTPTEELIVPLLIHVEPDVWIVIRTRCRHCPQCDLLIADQRRLEGAMAAMLMDKPGKTLGDETLRTIARELVETVRRNTTIDWTVRESVRAKLRTLVKRILRKYGYPPDKQEKATLTVIAQAELIAKDWVG